MFLFELQPPTKAFLGKENGDIYELDVCGVLGGEEASLLSLLFTSIYLKFLSWRPPLLRPKVAVPECAVFR